MQWLLHAHMPGGDVRCRADEATVSASPDVF